MSAVEGLLEALGGEPNDTNGRGITLSAYLRLHRNWFDGVVRHIKHRPRRALSALGFGLLIFATPILLLAPVYLPADVAGFANLVLYTLLASIAGNLLLLLHLGLLRRGDHTPRHSLGAANRLTMVRFALVAPIVMLILHDHLVIALVLYVLCSATDVVDGAVARQRSETTPFGTVMDPLADIAVTASVFAVFLAKGWIPGWVFSILMVRYSMFFVGCAVLFVTVGPIRLESTTAGKIVGVLQAAAAILILVLAAIDANHVEKMAFVLHPFLGIIFGSMIVSQFSLGFRHLKRGGVIARS